MQIDYMRLLRVLPRDSRSPCFPGTWPGWLAERFVRDRTLRESSIKNNDMFSIRLVVASLALLLPTTEIDGTNQNTTQPRRLAFAGIGEINGIHCCKGNNWSSHFL
jgi:hypothetical protein